MANCTSSWDIDKNMPDQTGKVRPFIFIPTIASVHHSSQVAIVTGGNTGLGKELVRQLAKRGAHVYMASRTESRAKDAIAELTKEEPDIAKKGGSITFLKLDLADLATCQSAAKEVLTKEKRLDVLSE